MRLKTILKELDKILDLYERGKRGKALRMLVQLRNRIELKLKEEEEKQKEKNPKAHELAKWYWGLWEGRIPEGNFARAVNVFRSLLDDFKLSEEEIKSAYSWWLSLKKEEVPPNLHKAYSIVLTEKESRSITDFRGKLRYVIALKREMENSEDPWGEARGDEYYRQVFGEEDQLPW